MPVGLPPGPRAPRAVQLSEWLRRPPPLPLRPQAQAITLEVIMRAVFGLEDGAAMARLRGPIVRLLGWASSPLGMFAMAGLGPDHGIVRRHHRGYMAPIDRELHALIAARRA